MNSYILEGREPVRCNNLSIWINWFQAAKCSVAKDTVNNIHISTVFLGIDHQFGEGKPLLFETLITGGKHDQEIRRYSTWREAEEGHKQYVERISNENDKP